MTYRGHVKNGAVILDTPVNLEDGLAVEIVVSECQLTDSKAPEKTLFERLKPFIGMVNDMPSDAAEHLDHYLYGTPKE
ncbi:MAG TPA: hypothetical protein PLI09_21950 [Candidatus Hydrogenedentes bacterium]|nr:hypothetical protein [Candidatus Hydrogenedentota bacterium]